MLKFNQKDHTYTWKDSPVPGVSEIMEHSVPFLSYASDEAMYKSNQFGKVVHKVTELSDKNRLSQYNYPEEVQDYLNQWKLFKKEIIPELKKNGYGSILCDIKTGAFSPKWFLQLAAYERLWFENNFSIPSPKSINVSRRKWKKKKTSIHIESKFYSWQYKYAGTIDRIFILNSKTPKHASIIVQLLHDRYRIRFPVNPHMMDFNVFLSMKNIFDWKKANNLIRG